MLKKSFTPLNSMSGSPFKTGATRIPFSKLFSSIYSENKRLILREESRTVPLGGSADNNSGGVVSFGPPSGKPKAAHCHVISANKQDSIKEKFKLHWEDLNLREFHYNRSFPLKEILVLIQ